MACSWEKTTLGRSGVTVAPLGIGSSFGVGGRDLERAFERGINYFYWGSYRSENFAKGLRSVFQTNREKAVLVIQSYTRAAFFMKTSLERGLRALRTDYTDFLLLGWWNVPPPARIIETALTLKERGLAKHIMISCHHRPQFEQYIQDLRYDAIMLRYNAAHPGAEQEVFPKLSLTDQPPGVVAYTATRWGHLINPNWVPANERVPSASDCYRFVLSNPHVNVAICGPRNGQDLDAAMTALDRGPLSQDEDAWMRRVGAAVRAKANEQGPRPIDIGDKIVDVISRF